jgi:hypothetical protein
MRGTVERVERAKTSGPTEIVFKQPNKVRITETLPREIKIDSSLKEDVFEIPRGPSGP